MTLAGDTIARYKRLLGGEGLFPQRGVGFPLLSRKIMGTYRFKVLSLVHVCPNVFKPVMSHIPAPPVTLKVRGLEEKGEERGGHRREASWVLGRQQNVCPNDLNTSVIRGE